VTFANVSLAQQPLNTGLAHLMFQFSIEYQLDGAGLPLQATLFPAFAVTGTVQPGGFAFVSGAIDYYGTNTAGTISQVEQVTYNQTFLTPGPFGATVFGVPTSGTTPALIPNTTLRLDGQFTFVVDPATINADSFMVPEPGAVSVLGLSSLALLRRRR
jgi:hypothetical protein